MEDLSYATCNKRKEPIYDEFDDTKRSSHGNLQVFYNPTVEDETYENIEDMEETYVIQDKSETADDIYDDVASELAESESSPKYENNIATTCEYINSMHDGPTTHSTPVQRTDEFQQYNKKEKKLRKRRCPICLMFFLLVITGLAVVGIGVYYHILITDNSNKILEVLVKQIQGLKNEIRKKQNKLGYSGTYRGCSFRNADGRSGSKTKIGNQTGTACIDACLEMKKTDDSINGVTVLQNGKGGCWCEKRMTEWIGNFKFKSCLLNEVDGGFGPWTNYTTCSKICGTGNQIRSRKCDSPPSKSYGKNCRQLGNATETRLCNTKPCPASWKLQKANVCFEAKGNKSGSFNIKEAGILNAIKLVHKSGYVSCMSGNNGNSNWGCGTNAIITIVTKSNNQLLFPNNMDSFGRYTIPNTNSNSTELWLVTSTSLHWVKKGEELRVWYGEDLKRHNESDNHGRVCVDVYADIQGKIHLMNPSQSSTHSSTYLASKALDGKLDISYAAPNHGCSHTLGEQNPWWKAQLVHRSKITKIRIFPRADCCQDRYTNVRVSTSLDGRTWVLCDDLGDKLTKAKTWVEATCPKGTIATFLKVVQHNNYGLVLCEVEVYGYPIMIGWKEIKVIVNETRIKKENNITRVNITQEYKISFEYKVIKAPEKKFNTVINSKSMWSFYVSETNGLRFQTFNSKGDRVKFYNSKKAYKLNEWVQVMVSQIKEPDGGYNVAMVVNGELQHTYKQPSHPRLYIDVGWRAASGYTDSWQGVMSGFIKNFSIYVKPII